jgi:hypothetical protein
VVSSEAMSEAVVCSEAMSEAVVSSEAMSPIDFRLLLSPCGCIHTCQQFYK